MDQVYKNSLSQEITYGRFRMGLGQVRLSRLLNMKVHRLSDLEKARSLPTPWEEKRIRLQLAELMTAFQHKQQAVGGVVSSCRTFNP